MVVGEGKEVAAASLSAGISIHIHSLRRSGLDALEAALNRWAHEYLQESLDASKGPFRDEEMVSGTLGVDTSTYASDGLLIWSDTCHPLTHPTGDTAAREVAANLAGIEEAAPLYDRCTNDALVSPPARGWHTAGDHAAPSAAAGAAGEAAGTSGHAGAATPGSGTSSTPRGVKRTAAEANLGDVTSPPTAATAGGGGGGGVTPGGDVGTPAAKRRFLGYQRCFNCGSYAHGLSGCRQPVDKERVAAAMREDAEAREAAQRSRATRFAAGRQRYFDTVSTAAADPHEGLRPGCISADLAAALGMPSTQHPPPWLDRMLQLGLPPAYMEEPAAVAGAAGEGAEGSRRAFIVREGDEPMTEPKEGVEGQEGDMSLAAAAAAAIEGEGGPIADQQAQQQQQEQQPASIEEGAAGGLSEGSIQLPQVVTDGPDGTADEAAAGTPGNGVAKDAAAGHGEPPAELVCSVVYPGVNGPLPEDPSVRGAWERALEVAGRVC